jgi:hypothetical protein
MSSATPRTSTGALHRYSAYAEKIIEAGEGDGMVFPAVYGPARGLRNAGGDDRLMGIVRTNECVCCGVMPGSGTLLAVVEALVPDSLWERVTPLSPACAPRRHRHPGRLPMNDRAALAGVAFVLEAGIGWNQLRRDLVGLLRGHYPPDLLDVLTTQEQSRRFPVPPRNRAGESLCPGRGRTTPREACCAEVRVVVIRESPEALGCPSLEIQFTAGAVVRGRPHRARQLADVHTEFRSPRCAVMVGSA